MTIRRPSVMEGFFLILQCLFLLLCFHFIKGFCQKRNFENVAEMFSSS